jgi:NAD(P)-dependent dehydrogenase (short-subunit alcohol dehydrogenase family)
MGRLDGRAAVITGAGDGIEEGIARRFAAEGARVLVSDTNESATHRVAESLQSEFGADAHPLTTDVRDKAEVLAMIATGAERFGTIDILVNNAWVVVRSAGSSTRPTRSSPTG